MIDLEEQLTEHLRNRAAVVEPRYDLQAVEQGIRPVKFADRDNRPNRRPAISALVGVAAAALIGVAVVATLSREDRSTTVTTPTVDTTSNTVATSGALWPQSSIDEVRQAQQRADAGDAEYAWQIDPQLSSQEWWSYLRQPGAEIVERFIRDELGWNGFLFNPYVGDDGDGAADGVIRGIVYLRCAAGETNPLYPIAPEGHQEAPGAELCAPTIDEFQYETVTLDLSQLDRRDSTGIWVVSEWMTGAPFAQTDPEAAAAEATTLLEEFLQARIEGEGAEGFVKVDGQSTLEEVPLLYATTSGAPYERYEIERMSGPLWPYGQMEFVVRLFADGGATVVEQSISWADWGLGLELRADDTDTTENGQAPAVPYSFFDGEVTTSAAYPWEFNWRFALALTLGDQAEERIEWLADPFPMAAGCVRGPAAADASAVAQSIQAAADLSVTAPIAINIGGIEGLAMDIAVVPGASACGGFSTVITQNDSHTGPSAPGVNLDQGSRMRLYLVDLPEGSATRVLAIAIVAPEARFEFVLEAAAPIIDAIKFHPAGS